MPAAFVLARIITMKLTELPLTDHYKYIVLMCVYPGITKIIKSNPYV